MTKDVKGSLSILKFVSRKLNSATDEATKVVKDVERFLNDVCSLGLECSAKFWHEDLTDYPDGEEDHPRCFARSTSLAYCRIGARFGIAVVEKDVERFEPFSTLHEDVTPWSSCSREIKLAAFEVLPELLRDAVKQAEAMLESTESTMKDVKGIAIALRSMVKS